jgi:hypothetical protein
VLLEPALPAGDGAAEAELAETADMIRTGRRGDAVASSLAGVGLPPEAVEGMRQSPEWAALLLEQDGNTPPWTRRLP